MKIKIFNNSAHDLWVIDMSCEADWYVSDILENIDMSCWALVEKIVPMRRVGFVLLYHSYQQHCIISFKRGLFAYTLVKRDLATSDVNLSPYLQKTVDMQSSPDNNYKCSDLTSIEGPTYD